MQIPVSKARTVVLSEELSGLAGEKLLIKAHLVTDATGLPAPARISTRLFIGDSPSQDEPGGAAQSAVTWKGNLSKYTGFNCLPAEGPVATEKYGVATVRQAPAGRSTSTSSRFRQRPSAGSPQAQAANRPR